MTTMERGVLSHFGLDIDNQSSVIQGHKQHMATPDQWIILFNDTIYIKTQVFRLLRYYSPAPRKIARSDWAIQNITHNMTSSLKQPYGAHSH